MPVLRQPATDAASARSSAREARRSWLQVAWLCALSCCAASPCLAQVTADDVAYRKAIDDATESYSNGLFDEALASFREAHRLSPSARTWRGLGMTNFEQRRYAKAYVALRKALDDPRKPLTDEQRADTQTLLARANTYIATFTLHITPADATLELDGIPTQLDNAVLLLDIGEHQLVLRAKDCTPRTVKLVVEGGEHVTLPIALDHLVATPVAIVPSLPQAPTREQVQAVMSPASPAVLACTDGFPGTATAKVIVSGRSGHVTKLDIDFDATFKKRLIPGPQLTLARLQYHYQSCVFEVLKGLQFPKFASSSFSVEYPYPLAPQRAQSKTARR